MTALATYPVRQGPLRRRPLHRAGMAVLVVWGVGLLFAATHKGEFWPFSTYSMFSHAGQPWMRVVIRDVTSTPNTKGAVLDSLEHLEGDPLPLKPLGVLQKDMNRLFRVADGQWNPEQIRVVRSALSTPLSRQRVLLAYRIEGRPSPKGRWTVRAVPMLKISPSESEVLNVAVSAGSQRSGVQQVH